MDRDFTDKEALTLLMSEVGSKSSELAGLIQAAIDEGKERRVVPGERGPISRRSRLSDGEALTVALEVLRSHFVDYPAFVRSAISEISSVKLGADDSPQLPVATKQIQFELETEEQFLPQGEPLLNLRSPSADAIGEVEVAMNEIYRLTGAKKARTW